MFRKKHLTFKILLFLIAVDILETFTQYCFKRTAILQADFEISRIQDAIVFITTALSSPFLWIGVFSVTILFAIWSTVLSKIDLSVAVPVCSFNYVLVPIASILFFHEQVSTMRWGGIFFVLLGVVVVSLTSKDKGHGTE